MSQTPTYKLGDLIAGKKQSADISSELIAPNQVTITNLDEFNSANALLTQWKDELKRVDADEKKITAPINNSLRDIRAKYKPVKERCQLAIDTLRGALNAYKRIEEERRENDRKALEELASDGSVPLNELVELVDEAPSLGGRLTTTVEADFVSLTFEYINELLERCREKVMIEIRKDVAAGRIEKGVTVSKEKKI